MTTEWDIVYTICRAVIGGILGGIVGGYLAAWWDHRPKRPRPLLVRLSDLTGRVVGRIHHETPKIPPRDSTGVLGGSV